MFDYARNMQLAVSDMARRAGMKAGAGVVALIGVGFLLAALWTWLASPEHLAWGPLGASLAIGGGFVVIGVLLLLLGGRVRHQAPTTEDLRAEVEARLSLATDAALDKARLKATEIVDGVENRVHNFVDDVSYRAQRFADDAENRVHNLTGGLVGGVKSAGSRMGFTAENLEAAREGVQQAKDRVVDAAEQAAESRHAPIVPLVGALALGITLASRFQNWRHGQDNFRKS